MRIQTSLSKGGCTNWYGDYRTLVGQDHREFRVRTREILDFNGWFRLFSYRPAPVTKVFVSEPLRGIKPGIRYRNARKQGVGGFVGALDQSAWTFKFQACSNLV